MATGASLLSCCTSVRCRARAGTLNSATSLACVTRKPCWRMCSTCAGHGSMKVTYSPAAPMCAPTSPPTAPAPTIAILLPILTSLPHPRGKPSAVLRRLTMPRRQQRRPQTRAAALARVGDARLQRGTGQHMAESKRWKRRPENSTWGDYGADDQLGRLNELTPAKVKQGIAEVREGKTFCLSLPLDYPGGNVLNPRRHPPQLRPTRRGERHNRLYRTEYDRPGRSDVVNDDAVILHLQYSTQWDTLAHVGALFDA